MDFSIPQGLGINKEALSMRHLSDLDNTEKTQKLSELRSVVDAYSGWIDSLIEKQKELAVCYQPAAEVNITGCQMARNRMLSGLRILMIIQLFGLRFLLQTGQCLCSEYI